MSDKIFPRRILKRSDHSDDRYREHLMRTNTACPSSSHGKRVRFRIFHEDIGIAPSEDSLPSSKGSFSSEEFPGDVISSPCQENSPTFCPTSTLRSPHKAAKVQKKPPKSPGKSLLLAMLRAQTDASENEHPNMLIEPLPVLFSCDVFMDSP